MLNYRSRGGAFVEFIQAINTHSKDTNKG